MRKYIGIALISVLLSLGSVLAFFLYVPLSWFQSLSLGATVTSISSTDSVKDALLTITNTNFSNINTQLETVIGTTTNSTITSLTGLTTANALTSATSLASIGTITTGTWNATPIGVAYNGTGTTSPSTNHVILGNGSSGFKVVDFGTSGQFLTSQGDGSAPVWTTSAIDQTLSYNFTGAYFGVQNLHASSTSANPIYLNGIGWAFPSADGANGQFMYTDGAGTLAFKDVGQQYSLGGSISNSAGGTASSTQFLPIPAGTLTASSTIEVNAQVSCNDTGTDGTCVYRLIDQSGNIIASCGTATNSSAVALTGGIHINAFNNNSLSSQSGVCTGILSNSSGTTLTIGASTNGTVDLSGYLELQMIAIGSGQEDADITKFILTVRP